MRFFPGRVAPGGKGLLKEAVLTDGACRSRSAWLVLSVPVSSSTKQACVVEADHGSHRKPVALNAESAEGLWPCPGELGQMHENTKLLAVWEPALSAHPRRLHF